MKVEVHLHTAEPHRILLKAESDAERKLLQIFDGQYQVTASLITDQQHHVYSLGYTTYAIEGVEIQLSRPEVKP